MLAEEFNAALLDAVEKRCDIVVEQHPLVYVRGSYHLIKIKSRRILPDDKVVMILAGLHGEEIAGPLTMLEFINGILNYLSERNLKTIIYPLCNPSGFENGTRYSIDSPRDLVPEKRNNDFLRYELADGSIVQDIGASAEFLRWHCSSDPKLNIDLPQETRMLHALLREDQLRQVAACIELHQDYITQNVPAAAYHYAYGDLARYQNIAKLAECFLPLLKNQEISAGYPDGIAQICDEYGFIVRHDGSVSDLLWRIGAEHAVTVETTGNTPLSIAKLVNLIWICGIARLI